MKFKFAIISISLLALSGCAANHAIIDIAIPTSAEVTKPNGKTVYINTVTDQRVFESSRSFYLALPYIDAHEGLGSNLKPRAIGTNKKPAATAGDDMFLPAGKTVESVVETAIREVLTEMGYQVIRDKQQTTPNTYLLDVRIDKFWSWMGSPLLSKLSIPITMDIDTTISITHGKQVDKKLIAIQISDNFFTGVEDNFRALIPKAIQAYITELKINFK